MMNSRIFITILLSCIIASIHAYDPDALQDLCVADKSHGTKLNGFPCKEMSNITSSDFFFAGISSPAVINSTMGSAVTGANVEKIPGLNTLSVSLARIDYAPGGLNPPHTHPRATEVVFVLEGELEVGFITTANKLFSKTIKLGEVFVFPRGLVHFQKNNGKSPASVLCAFNSQLPGTVSVAATLFATEPALPEDVLTKTFHVIPIHSIEAYNAFRVSQVHMETLWTLLYLLEPAPATLILTAVTVTFASAFRALNYSKEMERNRDFSEASITLDTSQALMIPVMSSCSLLLMFYLFSSVSQLLTAFTAVASVSSLFFWLSPYALYVKSQLGLSDPFLSRCCSKSFTRIQGLLLVACAVTVVAWLVSGHWVLNNLLGISICIAFVSHVRLPNIKTCAMLLLCLFVYDIFWVFFSERFFGANVMVTVATQQASNPVHTVANSLNLPGLELITKKLELPVKIVFPRNLLGGVVPGVNASDFMMLGLGDMAIPAMLLALILCFDHRKTRDVVNLSDLKSSKGHKYIWYALPGYAIGLVSALAAGVLTHSPQPALLYLVPSTLGPVIFMSWRRKDLAELWEGSALSSPTEKSHEIEI